MAIRWQYKNNGDRRSYKALPSGVYRVQVESAEETVSASGNQMIQMVLRVLGYSNRVRHYLTFSPKNCFMVSQDHRHSRWLAQPCKGMLPAALNGL